MQKLIEKAFGWLIELIKREITEPITKLTQTVDQLEKRVTRLHEPDEIAKECDLSVMDDRICSMIDQCRSKGYTTSEDRRRVGRMHEAYKARGGNHGEENEYALFCRLPTEEEYNRAKRKENDA